MRKPVTTHQQQSERVVLFGTEYTVVKPADGFRIAVETFVVKSRLEDALVCLGKGNTEKAVELLDDALREIRVAENFDKVPMLVSCLAPETAPHDQHGPTMFEMK